MYEPDVTVITTTSNIVEHEQADDFALLVNLLDRQTYPQVEHLVIDNASTDGTIDLLKDYKNLGYLNFFTEPDNGKFEAYNKGLMRAKGKYVSFISCDDFYHDITAIQDMVDLMEQEDADFCFFPSYCVHPEGYAFQFVPAILNTFQVTPCPRQAMFFKRTALESVRGFDDKFKLLADYDLQIRLMLNGLHGVYFERNVMTYKLGEQGMKRLAQVEAECSHIFYKNYKNLYPMTNDVLDRMVKYSEIPKPLLEKLSTNFAPEDKELFFQMYEQMYTVRNEAIKEQRARERRNR